MRTRARVVILFLTVCAALGAQESKLRVAVFDPTTSGVAIDDGTRLAVQELISSAFVNTGQFIMVERSMIDKILREQSFNNSDLADNAQATEIGKLAGANKVILSAISLVGGRNMLSIKMIDVETAAVEKQKTKVVNSGDLLDIVEPLVLVLLGFEADFTVQSAAAQQEQSAPRNSAAQAQARMQAQAQSQTQSQTQSQAQPQTKNQIQPRTRQEASYAIDIPGLRIYVADRDETKGRKDEFDWSGAILQCSSLGPGWRLPTTGELRSMWGFKSQLNLDRKSGYWSSEEKNRRNAWYIDWKDGDLDDDDKSDADKRCRCVMTK